jgi:hypothetical protein
MPAQRLDGRRRNKRHERQLHAVLLLEAAPLPLPQADNPGHVHLVNGVDMRADAHALDHPLGNDGAHPAQRRNRPGSVEAASGIPPSGACSGRRCSRSRAAFPGPCSLKYLSTSSLVIRPPAARSCNQSPRSRLFSFAIRRTSGEDRTARLRSASAHILGAATSGRCAAALQASHRPPVPEVLTSAAPPVFAADDSDNRVDPNRRALGNPDLVSTPATGDGISASTLSVEISNSGSSFSTASPAFFNHLVMVPSKMDSPICGITTSVPPEACAPPAHPPATAEEGLTRGRPCPCPASPLSVTTATTVLIPTVAPSSILISLSTPATGDGISASTLSVEISNSGSSFSHRVPGLFQPFGNGALKDRLAHLRHHYVGWHGSLSPPSPGSGTKTARPGSSRIINRASPSFRLQGSGPNRPLRPRAPQPLNLRRRAAACLPPETPVPQSGVSPQRFQTLHRQHLLVKHHPKLPRRLVRHRSSAGTCTPPRAKPSPAPGWSPHGPESRRAQSAQSPAGPWSR